MREATIHLPDEQLAAMGIGGLVAAARAAGLEGVTELQCARSGCLVVLDVTDPVPPERLSGLESVEWWERIEGAGGPTYLCKVAVPALSGEVDPHHETAVSEDEIAVSGDGLAVTMVGSQDDLSDRVGQYDDAGANPLLRTLSDYDGPGDPLDSLTDRQREVLVAAFEAGHFEVPRAASAGDVAAELDLDPSTVREHLQRAQRNLLAELLDRG